jgi:hypothetical protein
LSLNVLTNFDKLVQVNSLEENENMYYILHYRGCDLIDALLHLGFIVTSIGIVSGYKRSCSAGGRSPGNTHGVGILGYVQFC